MSGATQRTTRRHIPEDDTLAYPIQQSTAAAGKESQFNKCLMGFDGIKSRFILFFQNGALSQHDREACIEQFINPLHNFPLASNNGE
jgi:hypothetical protein